MKRISLVLLYIIIFTCGSWAQDTDNSILNTFLTNFEKGDTAIKLEVLKDAVDMGLTGMGPLYLKAINFVVDSADLLDTELVYRQLSQLAVESIKAEKYTLAKDGLWNLFQVDTNTTVRVGILSVLGDIAIGDARTIKYVNSWLDNQNNIFMTGKTPDMQVISACIDTLGKFGDPSSFPILFRARIINYSDPITLKVDQNLELINGDFKQLYTSIIKNGFFKEKKLALTKVLTRTDFTDADKCEVAEFALNIALYSTQNTDDEKQLARETRYMAVNFLGEMNYSNATELLIEHFNRTNTEMDKGIAGKNYVIQAIGALGNMKTHEAAKRLTLHLDLINSYTENSKAYDEQIVMAVINSLHVLGDKVASGTLLYTKYLKYNNKIKDAAAKAVKALK